MTEITRLKDEPPSTPQEEPPSGLPTLLSRQESQTELFGTNPADNNSNGNGFGLAEGTDGAVPQAPIIAPELESRKLVAADSRYPLHERIEAFEDITDSEVGDTALSRARNLEREVGMRQIYLKFEGGNPTGTQKDRIAFAQAMDAVRRGFDAITVATCGNYGAAVALAASMAGLACYVYIPEAYRAKRIQEMLAYKARIIRVPGDYEASVEVSRERALKDEIYDANPGGENTSLQLMAYGAIAYEIYDELRDAPAVVAVPVSNGTTLAGIYKGFLSLYRRGKTSRMPRMVAGSSLGKNPIVRAFIKNVPHCENLEPRRIRETAVNEPLINWHSIDGDLALDAVRTTGGWAQYASDKSLISYARLIKDREGYNVLPASTAGLSVLLERHKREPLPGDRYVAILTGRRS
jgi:threonine synthase